MAREKGIQTYRFTESRCTSTDSMTTENVGFVSCLGRPIRVESYREECPGLVPHTRKRKRRHQEQDPASSDDEALNEILAQRESRKRRSLETLTASEAPPLPPPVPPRVQEVAQRAAHSTRTASEALPLAATSNSPTCPRSRATCHPLDLQAGRLKHRRRTSLSSSPSPTAKILFSCTQHGQLFS